MNKSLVSSIKKCGIGLSCALLASQVYAIDKLAGAMQGDVQDMLGGQGTFWKVFILVDIILSAAMAVKTKNPMMFVGVFAIALLPAFMINTSVHQRVEITPFFGESGYIKSGAMVDARYLSLMSENFI